MGGRIYDAQIARFLSADPHVQDLYRTQSLNRYSYVINNPLAYTDPSGFFFKKIFKAIKRVFKAVARAIQRSPILRTIATIALSAVLPGIGSAIGVVIGEVGAGILASAIIGGIADGVNGAIFGALNSGATFGIGDVFGHVTTTIGQAAIKAVAHSVTQGVFAVAQGGEFGPAALSAGFSVFVGGFVDIEFGLEGAASLVSKSVIGGTGSVIGGGKFQNGAATAAFIWFYNEAAASLEQRRQQSAAAGALAGAIGGGLVATGCTFVSGGVCALGAPGLVSGGAALGGALGYAYPSTSDLLDSVIGSQVPASINSDNAQTPPVPGATPGKSTKGRATNWEKPGGIGEANGDFDAHGPLDVKPIKGGGRVGKLGDGRNIIVRPNSTDGRPTLEIQGGKRKTKIGYGE